MTFFNSTINARLINSEKEQIEEIVKYNRDRYENVSDFVRVAVVKAIREHKGGLLNAKL